MSTMKRIYYHTLRFRNEFLFAGILSIVFFLFYGGFFPEDDIGELVDVFQSIGILGGISSETAGWSIWMSIMLGLFMYVIVAITSINIGSRIIPTREEDGSEFFMGSNPMDPRRFYVENMIAGLLVIFAMMVPSFIIVVAQTVRNDASEVLGKISLAFFAFMVIAYFFMSLTSAVTTSLFQRELARGTGFGYVFYGLLMELFANSPNTDLQEAAKLSVNYYASVVSLITEETYDWSPILVIALISTAFVAIGFFRVKSPHYIEKATSKERFSIVDATTGYFVRPLSRFSRRYPLISEQLRKDKKAMFVLILVFVLYFPTLLSSFKALEGDVASLASTFNSPSTQMMIQGHELDATMLGFGILKFYSVAWLWFGVYSMLVAVSIPTREVRTNSQDIIYGTNVKPGNLMDHRVIAMLIEFTIILWLGFALMTGISYSFGDAFINDFTTIDIQFNYFFVVWIHYSAIFIAIVAIAMIPKELSKGRRYGITFFVISLLLSWIPYSNEDAKFLRYFSIFDYYETVPILYGEVKLFEAVLKSGIILILTIAFYFVTKKYRYENSSLY